MLRIIVLIFFALATAPFCAATEIVDMINRGDIDEALRQMEKSSSATHRDGTLLFARALLESDGNKSLQYLETAEKSGVDPEYQEEIVHLKILFQFTNGNYDDVVSLAESYLKKWENGHYRAEVLRMAAIAYERTSRNRKNH